MARNPGSNKRPVAAGVSWLVFGGLALLALGVLMGVISLAPGQRAGAADAGTALDFSTAAPSDYVTLGTRNGTTINGPTRVAGQFGNGLQFNGTNQSVTFGTAPGLGASTFTIETWFNWTGGGTPTNTGSGGLENTTAAIPLVTKGRAEVDDTNQDMNYFLGISGGKLAADFEEGPGDPVTQGNNHPVIGDTTITTNVWHHAAATYDGSTWKLYLDGTLDKTLGVTGNPPRFDSIQHAGLGIAMNSTGANPAPSGFFAGTLDEARIWNVARAQVDIQTDRNIEVQTAPGLIGRWGMNEASGTLVANSTPSLGVSNFTVETWFKREGDGIPTSTGALTTIVPLVTKGRGEGDGSNIDMNYFLGVDNTNLAAPKIAADFEEGVGCSPTPCLGANNPVTGGTTIVNGVWYHAAVTYDGTQLTLYLNGVQDGQTTVTGVSPPRSDSIQYAGLATAMNSTGVQAGFFDGVLDEARVWDFARSAGDIDTDKAIEINSAAGLVGRWGMNEGSDSYVGDTAGGSNHGLAVNGPAWVAGFPLPGTPTPTPTASPTPGPTSTSTPTPTTAPSPTLAGHWTMDLGSATQIDDSSGLGNHGTLFNQATRVMSGKTGTHALAVDGTSGAPPADYALVPDHASLDITGAITLAAWIKPEQRATQDLFKKATFGSVNGYEITLASSTSAFPNKVFVRFNQATAMDTLRVNSTTEYPFDGATWIHVAATYDGSTIRLYINGTEEGSLAASFAIATNNVGLSIGAQNDADATRAFKGQLDDVRVYSGALSAAAIAALAGNPSPTPTPTATPTATPVPTGTPAPTATPTVVPVAPVAVSADTGEKPQSKVWLHAGTWWAVLPSTSLSPAGTWLWRLEGNDTWTNVLHLSNSTTARADAKAVGNVTHILLHGSSPELVSVQHVPAGNTYQLWPARITSTPISLPDSETATIDIDSSGRMWLATESVSNVNVYYSDSPYSSFTGPITLANNINADDISVVTALPNNTVGVLWSNQTTQRFGFRAHVDGTDPNTWLADEVPASQSALNVGLGMADDHLNVAVGSDGTLYAAVKTSYDTAGFPRVALLIRRPSEGGPGGTWDDLYGVDEQGTRGIVLLNEVANTLRLVYTSAEGLNNIVSKESSVSSISFGPRQTLMTGGLNNASSTKQNWTNEVVVLASSGSSTQGVRIVIPGPTPTPTPAPTATPSPTPTSDSDGDGFTNAVETSAGTNPFLACGVDAWPADINNDTFSDISDMTPLTGSFGQAVGPPPNPPARYDIAPDPPDGFVDITDVARMTNLFGISCASGTPTSTPTATPTPTPTPAGTALDFDGSNDHVTFGVASGLGTANFTVETWFKREGAGVGTDTGSEGIPNAIPLVTKGRSEVDGSNVDMNYFLGIRASDGVLVADFEEAPGGPGPAGQNHPVIGSTVVSSNVWHHAAATYNGSTWRLYLDGNVDAQLALTGNPAPRSDSIQHAGLGTALNSTGVASGFFAGVIDEARVWNFARDQTQIQATKNLEVPSATGLIGRWGLNEGINTSVGDSSGGGNNGTATNGPLWVSGFIPGTPPTPTPTPTPGGSGNALDFDGSDDHVTFGPALGLGTATFTIETWFKREGAGVGTSTGTGGIPDAIPLLTKGRADTEGSSVDMNYFLGIRASDSVLVADFEEGPGGPGPLGQNHPVIGTTVITSNVWHHAAATYDGSTWRLYLDGNPQTPLAVSGNPPPRSDSIQHAGLGTAFDSTGAAAGFFAGVIDEARVWNFARDQTQILATKNIEVPAASGLIGRWGMNEGNGTAVADSSGNAENGTATNGPVWVPGAPFSGGGSPPATPVLNAPADGATGVSTSPTLDVSVSDQDGDDLSVSFYGRPLTPPSAPDFTIVHIPDTQHYVDDAARAFQFGEQTNWIVENEAALNTEFVTHSGDIVEHIDQFEQEWIYASGYMATLDNAGIKNNLAPGNHDLTSGGVANFSTSTSLPAGMTRIAGTGTTWGGTAKRSTA
jgi:Concanavalin A-like lectin/glucanases superfamily/Bacterial TSP3 repeat